MSKGKSKWLFSGPFLVWTIAFIMIPLAIIVYYGLTDADGGFTLNNIAQMGTPENIKALVYALVLSLISTIICLIMAYPLAMILCNLNFNANGLIVMIFIVPMWMNFLIRTYSWISILANTGIINSLLGKIGLGPLKLINTPGAVILGMVYEYLPFMVLPIYTVMSKIDNGLIEAAQDLGSNNFTVFRKVVAPLSVPGIISGVTMVFVPSASTFLVAQYLGGPDDIMIGDVIEKIFWTDQNTGSASSLILMIFIFVFLIIMNLFGDEEAIA